jgi:hypothetical protein
MNLRSSVAHDVTIRIRTSALLLSTIGDLLKARMSQRCKLSQGEGQESPLTTSEAVAVQLVSASVPSFYLPLIRLDASPCER